MPPASEMGSQLFLSGKEWPLCNSSPKSLTTSAVTEKPWVSRSGKKEENMEKANPGWDAADASSVEEVRMSTTY